MLAIKAHFDGNVFVPDEPVRLSRGEQVVVQPVVEQGSGSEEPPLRPLVFPSDPEAARRLISDVESGLENF